LEIIKVAQMLLLNDIDMYHEETDTPFEARTSTINEDCGQISYIFSDKTGTLTDNSMLFRKLSVGGQAWLHDLDIRHAASEEAAKLKHKRTRKGKGKGKSGTGKKIPTPHSGYGDPSGAPTRKSMGDVASSRPPVSPHRRSLEQTLAKKDSLGSMRWKSSADPSRPQPQMSTSDLLEYLRTHPHTFFARKARFFLLSIALCHTCLPEEAEDGSIDYQAASPDELALVRAAQELGYIAIERQFDSITIKTYPNGLTSEPLTEIYQILEVIEFSSKRKRMSVLIRMPNGRICIFSKGADTTMIELLKLRDLAKSKAREIERKESVRRSIEAQEMIRRNSMHRTSIGGRPSIGDRSSIGGPSRPSFSRGRLRPIHDELDYYLRAKERDLEADSDDDSDSGQSATRHSIALGDRSTAPLEPGMDEHIVDEELVLDDSKVFERCFQHVNHFATEGLRTLLYAHRFIEEHEYAAWRSIYSEATTSLVDRTARIEEAAEIIERDFELTGATAIEDKLQKGVPEAIDKLRSAGIKMWMLTGDKRETAINIGHSCRLIKDYSTVTILSHDDPVIASTMRGAIADISQEKVAHSVVVVDGGTLAIIEADEGLSLLFFELAVSTDSVICCRASPSQKAGLVKTIRTKVTKSVTLAIGDGANDIAMIQEAHVGVGITGKEGLQAARVSDYSMAQFRFLLKFLLVHGRWNYVRTTKYTVATFWKVYIDIPLLPLWALLLVHGFNIIWGY
jgi:phospholipid-translocating ATPase